MAATLFKDTTWWAICSPSYRASRGRSTAERRLGEAGILRRGLPDRGECTHVVTDREGFLLYAAVTRACEELAPTLHGQPSAFFAPVEGRM